VPNERFVSSEVSQALTRLREEIGLPWAKVSRPFSITFPAAATVREVAHGMSATPGGMLVLRADGAVYANPGQEWTSKLAYLTAPVANTRATVVFLVLREGVTNA